MAPGPSSQPQSVTEFMKSHGFEWDDYSWTRYGDDGYVELSFFQHEALFFYTICQKAAWTAQLAILKKVGQAYHKEEYQDKAREALSFALWAEIDRLEAQLTPPQDTKPEAA